LDLIPINFFMHNSDGYLVVDELVFQAVSRPHSALFDRFALFAFHLSRVGGGRDSRSRRPIEPRPALWANEFVREQLWQGGVWRRDALTDVSLDTFLAQRMTAGQQGRIKSRNNYRHLFELCDYWPAPLPLINSGAHQWAHPALMLAWDRFTLDGGSLEEHALLDLVETEELYKLLGLTRETALSRAATLAPIYVSVGGVDRFRTGATPAMPATPHATAVSDADWVDQEGSDEAVERRSVERLQQQRCRKLAAALKLRYQNCCIFCGTQLNVGAGLLYSEAAHIKPLGLPHNGPDTHSNMLILCPNHHKQFDAGWLRLQKQDLRFQITSKDHADKLEGKLIELRHQLNEEYVRWHYNWFSSRRT